MNKKLALGALFIVALTLIPANANARPERRTNGNTTTTGSGTATFGTTNTAGYSTGVSRRPSAGGGGLDIWAGLALDAAVTRSTTTPSISALFILQDKLSLQTYAMLADTSPFLFAIGANMKYSLIGDAVKGFHIGGGFGLGTIVGTAVAPATTGTDFFVDINALMGLHFPIVESVMINIDGGATLGVGGNNTTFVIGGNSVLLGLSILYNL